MKSCAGPVSNIKTNISMEPKNENQYLSLILDIAFCKCPCLYEIKLNMKKIIIRITGNLFKEIN